MASRRFLIICEAMRSVTTYDPYFLDHANAFVVVPLLLLSPKLWAATVAWMVFILSMNSTAVGALVRNSNCMLGNIPWLEVGTKNVTFGRNRNALQNFKRIFLYKMSFFLSFK